MIKETVITRTGPTTYNKEVDTSHLRRVEVEIGDSKQAEFYPQLKTLHWNNECNLSVRLVDALPTEGLVSLANDVVEWSRAGRKARFYTKSTRDERGAFEFEVEFSEAPSSNILEFSLLSKGVDFLYQPPLTDEYVVGQRLPNGKRVGFVSETFVQDEQGDPVAGRPVGIVKSIAVYHTTKRDNKIGENEYLTGKLLHIYRPDVVDSLGRREWCDMSIESGLLRIEIPQKFLDEATYPVIIDPTLGYTTIGGSEAYGGSIELNHHTASENGSITSLSTYGYDLGGGIPGTVVVGSAVYSDNAGAANAKLAEDTGNVVATGTPQWLTVNLSLSIISGTKYWLATWGKNWFGYANFYDTGSLGIGQNKSGATWETWPDPITAGNTTRKNSLYATYAASAGPIGKVIGTKQAIQRASNF